MGDVDDAPQSRQARELFGELRQLHVRAGEPSSRAVADRAGGMSHTTVNQVLRGRRIPSWPILLRIVQGLDGDEDLFRVIWNSLHENREKIDELPSPGTENRPEVSVFASYAHVDNKATYDRIRHFIRDVSNVFSSMTGLEVGIFYDRDSIAPGEEWKDRIRLGLSSSSVLLSFISPAYLRSVYCTQEFWEFLHFLRTNSTTRLIVPLVFADLARIEKNFADNDVWVEVSKLHWVDIAELRFESQGSRLWLERVQDVAECIEEVLEIVAREPRPQSEIVARAETPQDVSLDLLGRMAAVEASAPITNREMDRLAAEISKFGVQMGSAGPLMSRAATIKKKVGISKQLAKQLDPIADSMLDAATNVRAGIMDWDATVRALLEFTSMYPSWLDDNPGAVDGVNAIYQMAVAGIESFQDLEGVHQIFGQGRGLSGPLDEPLRKAQDALMQISDVRGLFVGWKDGIDALGIDL